MSRGVRGALGLLTFMLLLAIPSAVFATDGYAPSFYVFMTTAGKTELVKMPTLEKIADLGMSELPLTIEEAMPDIEVKAFQDDLEKGRISEEFNAPGINSTVMRLWAVKSDEFLLHRQYWKCDFMLDPCYGYTALTLLNTTAHTERVLWTLPYHQDQEAQNMGGACYQDVYYENYSGLAVIEAVDIHPSRDLFSIHVTGCKEFMLLLDYSTETPQIQKLERINATSWSPDGTQLAYIERQGCDDEHCAYDYGRLSLETGEKTPFQHLTFEHAIIHYGFTSWIEWLDDQTIVYSRPLEPEREWKMREAVAWHHLRDGTEIVVPLYYEKMPSRVFRLSDGSQSVIYSETWVDGETRGWNTILTDDPFDMEQGYQRVSSANSRNTQYAVVSTCSGLTYYCEEAQPGFIDVEGNLTRMSLASVSQEYREAERVWFAAVAVEQP